MDGESGEIESIFAGNGKSVINGAAVKTIGFSGERRQENNQPIILNTTYLKRTNHLSYYWSKKITRPSKMEIYHRDHWIIIVHMATWKDLTKWNEENTIMDWINHMGRIVKRVFPVPSRLQREGHASEKD